MTNRQLFYKITETQSADELWDMLSPTRLNEKGKFAHLKFRGHANSNWKLIPTSLREGFHKNNFLLSGIKNLSDIVANEIAMLFHFARSCDRVGISIPNDSILFRNENLILTSNENGKYFDNPALWPNPKLYEIMAMAQHHGVPTRLLDWSDSPYIAAYFAASGAIEKHEEQDWISQKLAIWAVRNPIQPSSNQLQFIQAPGSVSKHLPSQRGSFSVHPIYSYTNDILKTNGLEDYNFYGDGFEFYKFTLPVTEAVRLLHLCSVAGFTAAELFPSADGAGRAVKEAMLLTTVINRLQLNYDGSSSK